MKACILDYRTAEITFIEASGWKAEDLERYIEDNYHEEIEYMIGQTRINKVIL